jgi:hypothetical protein
MGPMDVPEVLIVLGVLAFAVLAVHNWFHFHGHSHHHR